MWITKQTLIYSALNHHEKTTLIFPNEKLLWAFIETLQSKPLDISSAERKLTCRCTDSEITKALIEYKAEIVDESKKEVDKN